ncbi:L,D-transpeptidase family protein [Bacillus sp. FJAT-29790]|uniref:L,D-transpeptidase family protein n=1 Tax=Bacillus sp. FJAT-29790 TaxID=1895002 RepID=UPI001C2377C7|nr:L,D-transpeptidase family protein [Bacillus sp. FJAT-29790]MBU8879139.1 L,D-transpeptidase family protein [Bacillus sp. FJAT-29790]
MKIHSLIAILIFSILFTFFSITQVQAASKDYVYIKVNLWSNELLVIENNEVIKRYPISPGTENSPTPIGIFKVTGKSKSWGGGFGSRWLGLNVPWGIYGIHGTNKPSLIGKNVSSGCIRMRNEDVESLFEIIPNGTMVHIDGPLTGTGKGEFKSLSIGSKGNLVQLVQERLKAMGLYHGTVDGIYDLKTERAVEKFQKLNDLPMSGVVTIQVYMQLGLLE